MKNKRKMVIIVIDLLAAVILFLCLGLISIGNLFAKQGVDPQALGPMPFWSHNGISIAFFLTVLAVIFLYINQKILYREQQDLARIRSKGFLKSLASIDSDYQQLLNIAPIGIIQTNYEGEILFSNPTAAQIFGFTSVKEFTEATNQDAIGFQKFYFNKERCKELLRKLYSERRLWVESCERLYRQDGSVFDAVLYLSLRHDEEKNEEFIVAFFEDVTSRLENERRLQVSEKRFRDLLDKASSIIVKVDPEGRIIYFNNYAQDFFGYKSEEVLNKYVVGTIIEDIPGVKEGIEKVLKDICQNPDDFRLNDSQHVCRDGRCAWVRWSNKAIVEQDGTIREILAIGTDMTQNKNLEESLHNQIGIERILKDVSHRLAMAELQDAEGVISTCLKDIKNFFGGDCIYICLFDEKGFVDHFYYDCCSPDQNWCKEFVDRAYLSRLFWWVEEFAKKDFVVFKNCDELPQALEPAKEACRQFGILSLAAVPIFSLDKFVGFVGLNCRSSQIAWEQSRMGLLRLCGEVFLNAIQKKAAQEELVKAKERVDLAVRGAYLGMYDWDIESGDIVFNDIWFRMLGYSPRELPHTFNTWKKLLHPDDEENVVHSLTKYLNGEAPFFNEEFRLLTKNDEWKWVQAQGHLVNKDDANVPTRMIGLQRDVTELKLMTQELAHQRDIFQLLIENMPVGVFVKDVRNDFRFLVWNKSMGRIFRVYRNDVLDKNDYDCFDKQLADAYRKDDMAVIQSQQIKDVPQEIIDTADGRKYAHTIKVPISDENNNVLYLLGILEDVTEREKIEQQLRHTQKMQSIGQLAAGVAHEIKNPLAIIQLAAEGLLIDKVLAGNKKVQSKASMIKKSAAKANEIVLELLKFSRLSDEEFEPVDLHKAISDAYFLAQNRDKKKTVRFDMDFCKEDLVCQGNPVLFEQVFINFFNNAVDAIEDKGQVSVRTQISTDKSEICVEIEDTGCGIPRHIMTKIFDPFFTTKEELAGTGLGLSTTFMIVEKYKGSIAVESEVGKGSKFILKFPAVRQGGRIKIKDEDHDTTEGQAS